MAPVTRARRGDGKAETAARGGKRPNPPVEGTRTRTRTRGDGKAQTAGKRPHLSLEEMRAIQQSRPRLWVKGAKYVTIPQEPDLPPLPVEDDPQYDWPTEPYSYPEKKTVMEECCALKKELLSGEKIQALEKFLTEKKQGLTYKTAIEQLIQGSFDTTLKKGITKQICQYVAWRLNRAGVIMFRLLTRVETEKWDDEVIQLILEVVNSLKKDLVLEIPVVEAISPLANSLLHAPPDYCARGNLVEMLQKQLWKVNIHLGFPDELMQVWAKHPSKRIDAESFKPKLRF